MKIVTSIGLFNDAVGKRISITYSEVDDQTGQIISDNKRIDRVVTDQTALGHANALAEYAQEFVDAGE